MEQVDTRRAPALISYVSELTIVMVSIYLPYRAYQLGANGFLVGLVGASGSVVYMFAPFLTGRLTDRVGPRRLLILGTTTIALVCLLYTAITQPILFVAIRLVEGLGWAMIWPPLEALYSVSGSDLNKSMKTFNVAWGLGAITSPMLGSLVVDVSAVRWTMLVAAVLMGIALALTLTVRAAPVHQASLREAKGDGLNLWRSALLLSNAFAYGFTMTTISTFFPKYAASMNLEVTLWGTILSAIYAGRLVAFFFSERVMEAMGLERTRRIFLVAALCFPVCAVLPGTSAALMVIASFVTGVGFGLVYSATIVGVMGGPVAGRGRAAGLFESSLGLGSFVGPAFAGAVASSGLWLTMALPVAPILLLLLAGPASGRGRARLPSSKDNVGDQASHS